MADERAAYNVEAFLKEWQAIENKTGQINVTNPESASNPTLRDFLKHGYLTGLCHAILDDQLPEPWKTIALVRVPAVAMAAVIGVRMEQELMMHRRQQ